MITLDTSALLAFLNRRDPAHGDIRGVIEDAPGACLVPAGILAESTYMIEDRLGPQVLDAFLLDLEEGAFSLDCGREDWARIRTLVGRYADLPLGAADAGVVACAERTGTPILTLDRDFGVVAREGSITILP
ncbi:MAG: type II toxin-antitoxin system VapC family toxin [Candidatus Dormibacteraceae bacterium]